jgi:hypothetical protein
MDENDGGCTSRQESEASGDDDEYIKKNKLGEDEEEEDELEESDVEDKELLNEVSLSILKYMLDTHQVD